jgi:hypothetical protein
MLFEKYDVVATFRQVQRRRAASDPPADDTHVAVDRAIELRACGGRVS